MVCEIFFLWPLCFTQVLHVTTKMATQIEGNPKATTQWKVLGSWLTIFCLYSLFVKTSIMSSSVFIISLMYTPEFHLCYARNIFEKIMLLGQGLGQARPRPRPSPAWGPGLRFWKARALPGQAKALASRPSPAWTSLAEWLSIKLTHSNFDISRRSRVWIMVQSFISSINCVE